MIGGSGGGVPRWSRLKLSRGAPVVQRHSMRCASSRERTRVHIFIYLFLCFLSSDDVCASSIIGRRPFIFRFFFFCKNFKRTGSDAEKDKIQFQQFKIRAAFFSPPKI